MIRLPRLFGVPVRKKPDDVERSVDDAKQFLAPTLGRLSSGVVVADLASTPSRLAIELQNGGLHWWIRGHVLSGCAFELTRERNGHIQQRSDFDKVLFDHLVIASTANAEAARSQIHSLRVEALPELVPVAESQLTAEIARRVLMLVVVSQPYGEREDVARTARDLFAARFGSSL